MTFVPGRPLCAGLLLLAAAACQPAGDRVVTVGGPGTPQYAPDDPCKGVVPQLCPR